MLLLWEPSKVKKKEGVRIEDKKKPKCKGSNHGTTDVKKEVYWDSASYANLMRISLTCATALGFYLFAEVTQPHSRYTVFFVTHKKPYASLFLIINRHVS